MPITPLIGRANLVNILAAQDRSSGNYANSINFQRALSFDDSTTSHSLSSSDSSRIVLQ